MAGFTKDCNGCVWLQMLSLVSWTVDTEHLVLVAVAFTWGKMTFGQQLLVNHLPSNQPEINVSVNMNGQVRFTIK